MAFATTDDGVRLYYEETGSGSPSSSSTNSPAIIAAGNCSFSILAGATGPLPMPRAAIRHQTCRRIRRPTARTALPTTF
jgi:hypothetical protein